MKYIYLLSFITLCILSSYTILVSTRSIHHNKELRSYLNKRGGPSLPVVHKNPGNKGEGGKKEKKTTAAATAAAAKFNNEEPTEDQQTEETAGKTDDDAAPTGKKAEGAAEPAKETEGGEEKEKEGENKDEVKLPISAASCTELTSWVGTLVSIVDRIRSSGSASGKKKRIPDAEERIFKNLTETLGKLQDGLGCDTDIDLDNLLSSSD
ncbi:hypothetical protein BJ944DRAFT_274287 [Cunninghamella echinulata]|nr:hypothetical protein BJ944DRAFT_274287 [Cunninghamella echinulata]